MWDSEFGLLGIEFDNCLEKMERNFDKKLQEIKKVFNLWYYRTLTPYGKIVIIKTLALSKLSHAALVLPSLAKNKVKDLEKCIANFLWNGKPDKVSRDGAKLNERLGGLGLTDIKDF